MRARHLIPRTKRLFCTRVLYRNRHVPEKFCTERRKPLRTAPKSDRITRGARRKTERPARSFKTQLQPVLAWLGEAGCAHRDIEAWKSVLRVWRGVVWSRSDIRSFGGEGRVRARFTTCCTAHECRKWCMLRLHVIGLAAFTFSISYDQPVLRSASVMWRFDIKAAADGEPFQFTFIPVTITGAHIGEMAFDFLLGDCTNGCTARC